ncbi:hypothetical protein FRC06_006282 [Ceratobasidium sp. 370]|nr:hypothetical protein FRC06_006282 [Ceratobasidium sp. 370]
MSPSNFNSLPYLPEKHATKPRLFSRLIGLGKLPRLITTTNTVAGPDAPRITAVTVGAQKLSISIIPVSKAPEEPETGVYQTLESATRFAIIVPPSVSRVNLKLVHKGTHVRHTLNADLAPERLETFKYLVVERTRPHRLESMDPLKLAVHNNLARAIAALSRPGQVGNSPAANVLKPTGSQRMRRTRPVLPPLDTDAARAYTSTSPASDSPPESPGPTTPADETTGATRASKEPRNAKEKAVVPSKPLRKGVAHRAHSRGSKVRLCRRF